VSGGGGEDQYKKGEGTRRSGERVKRRRGMGHQHSVFGGLNRSLSTDF